MPMLDAYIPEGALAPQAEKDLIAKLTDLLLEHEGADPSNETARSIAWVFLHRPARVYVAGEPAQQPRYRFVASVPEGQFNPERRQAIVDAVTSAVLDAEGPGADRDPMRVWVFTNEVPDGTWGGGGRIVTLADIAGLVLGDPEQGRRYAEATLAARRGEAALAPAG
ncbi:MAG TPA: tautomerase family protein [Solirubrobacteraceae bacterium]|jgi:phenylpyruvate tautomerase PptA (4-oxalocrotonate tautomerase family)|nr:tautomerase family protein [Solirubrobacteraceae bacterium]